MSIRRWKSFFQNQFVSGKECCVVASSPPSSANAQHWNESFMLFYRDRRRRHSTNSCWLSYFRWLLSRETLTRSARISRVKFSRRESAEKRSRGVLAFRWPKIDFAVRRFSLNLRGESEREAQTFRFFLALLSSSLCFLFRTIAAEEIFTVSFYTFPIGLAHC